MVFLNPKSNMHGGANKLLYQRARELRNSSTLTEQILWGYLKTKPHGFKFRRQHPYSIYIRDFFCHSLKLVIEVDGSIHDLQEIIENDKQRQDLLEKDGLKVLRLNSEDIKKTPESIIKQLDELLTGKKNEQ